MDTSQQQFGEENDINQFLLDFIVEEQFISSVTCFVCCDLLQNALLLKCCSRRVCADCWTRWAQTATRCPHCTNAQPQPAPDGQFRFVSKRNPSAHSISEIISKLHMKCKWGCNVDPFLVENHSLHSNLCEAFPCLCPNGCTQKIPRKELVVHQEQKCPQRKIVCDCKATYKACEAEA